MFSIHNIHIYIYIQRLNEQNSLDLSNKKCIFNEMLGLNLNAQRVSHGGKKTSVLFFNLSRYKRRTPTPAPQQLLLRSAALLVKFPFLMIKFVLLLEI